MPQVLVEMYPLLCWDPQRASVLMLPAGLDTCSRLDAFISSTQLTSSSMLGIYPCFPLITLFLWKRIDALSGLYLPTSHLLLAPEAQRYRESY